MITKSGSVRKNNFNLIRFILASLVIISHCQEVAHKDKSKELLIQIFGTLSFGDVAVRCFFVLSGYLIVKSWTQTPKYSTYLRNRIFRIFPGFIGVSLICAAVVGPLAGTSNYLESFQFVPWLKSVFTLQYPVLPPVFEGSYYPMVNGSIWSINYEFKCYLLVVACAVAGLLKIRSGWAIVTVALLVSYFLAPLAIQQYPALQPKARALNLALVFAIGGCFYLYGEHLKASLATVIVSFVAWIFCMTTKQFAEIGTALFLGYVLVSFANTHFKSLSSFNKLPDMSYGIYLYGWPIMKMIQLYYPNLSEFALILSNLALSLCAGACSWYIFEKPFIAMKFFQIRKMQQSRVGRQAKS